MTTIKKIITLLLALLLLITPTLLAIFYSVQIAMVTFACVLGVLVILHPEKITEISFGNLKLKLREEIDKAEKTTKGLQKIAVVFAKLTISEVIRRENTHAILTEDSTNDPNVLSGKDIVNQLEVTLKETNTPNEEISKIMQPWVSLKEENK